MPATNVLILNAADKQRLATNAIGTGAIAATDELVTDLQKWPEGSQYYDKTNRIRYTRIATAGVIGDWAKTVADTVHT